MAALTVAVCTYNPRADLLGRCVRAIAAQLPDVGSAELLLIDNNSAPPLAEAEYLRGTPARIVREPVQGLTAARAAAVRAAAGDIILFVDDDNVLEPGYLQGVVAEFADPKLGVLGGAIVPEYESTPPSWLPSFERQLAIRPYSPGVAVETTGLPYTDCFPVGAGCSVRRDLAVAHLADSEQTGRIEGRQGAALSAGEDLDLDFYALSAGFKLKVTGALRLVHVIPAARCTEEYISRLVVSGLASTAELERKWSRRLGAPIFPYLHADSLQSLMRVAVFGVVSPLSVKARVKRRLWQAVRRIRARAQ